MARSLLKDFGCLRGLLNARLNRWRRKGIGPARYAAVQAAVELAKRHLSEEMRVGSPLTTPQATYRYLMAQLRDRPYEVFCCIYLDNRHRLIAFEELFRGTVDRAQVHPREVLRQALLHNASAVIVAHNHPSGVLEPSPADDFITRRLKDLLALMDVRIVDHIIVGDSRCYSFAEHGLL
jgi:DNA repair protein RadC